MLRRPLVLALLAAFAAAGCSSSSSPTAPTSPAAPASAAGTATITGSVLGGGGSNGSTSATSSSPDANSIVVTVVGTDISVTVDAARRFSLANVPPGTIQLQITGPGFSGLVTLNDVQGGDTIELSVRVNGSSVSVESEQRNGHDDGQGEEEIEGLVESLPPTTADGTLVVAGRLVTTDALTIIRMGSQTLTFADLAIGQRVHVKGAVDATSGDFIARLIDVQNTRDDAPVNLNGIATGVTGDATAFELTVNGRLAKGDDQTVFYGGSVFADLVDNVRVEIKGIQRDGYVYIERIHVNRDDDNGSSEFEEDGTLTAISGTIPTLTLTVNGMTILTTSATEIRRRGDTVPMEALQIGLSVEVEGTTLGTDNVAKKVTIESNILDVDVEGIISNTTGTCPDFAFDISTQHFVTDGLTEFKKADCTDVVDGAKLKLRGVLLSGTTFNGTTIPAGTVYVTRLEVSKKP